MIRIGVAGAGVIGQRHVKAISELTQISLAGIADPTDNAKQFAGNNHVPCFDTTEQLLDSIAVDGLIVATPTEHHLQPALCALQKGIAVLIEKPIVATLEQATQIITTANQNNASVLVGHHRRYYSLVTKARQLLQSGEIGKLVAVSGQWLMRKQDDYYGYLY